MFMRKLYQKLSLTIAFVAISISSILAQGRSVSGVVKDEAGVSMPGVSVLVKGTNTGTATDVDGQYRIAVPGDDAVLVFSFVGYSSTEVVVGARSTVDISLNPDVQTLSELVVTGYTTENRRDVVAAVSTVKAKDLTVVPSGNIEQQLQGRVPGVTVITNGQPGTTSIVRVRGFGAFGGNNPLYIVDGLPFFSIDFLNPDDVENTTVLKDAGAASIYGARASNGVIVITTKRGTRSSQKLSVTYDGMFGFTDPGEGQKMLNPDEFAEWTWNQQRNTQRFSGTAPTFTHPQFGTGTSPVVPDYILVGSQGGVSGPLDLAAEAAKYNVTDFSKPIYQVMAANKKGTDWYDEITRTAPLMRHSLAFSGAGENSRYYVGLGLQDQDGILLYQSFKRYSFRVNTEFDVLKNLRIGENIQMTYRQVRLLQGNSGGQGVSDDENDILQAFRMPSIIPVYDEFGGYGGTRAPGFNNPRNPVANLDRQKDNRGFQSSAFGNVYLEFEPIENLTFRTSIGGFFQSQYFWSYFARQYENSENNSAVTYNEGAGESLTWTFTNTLAYKKEFGQHNLNFLLGQEAIDDGTGRNMQGNGLNPFSEDRDFVTLSTTEAGSSRTVGSNYFKGSRYSSLFGKIDYNFNSKYYLTFVIRRDGSSRFAPDNRYGVFPAVSAGWRISEEPFLSGATWIDDFKIRGGWGEMGNAINVNPNNQYSLFGTNVGNSSYPINNGGAVEGYYRTRIGNPEAKWERAITTNVGFDASFFNGKLDVVFDWWKKNTDDLVFGVPITVMNGVAASPPDVNIGKMLNRGIDIQIISRGNITNDIGFELTVNGGFLKNEIVEIAPGITYLTGGNNEPSYRGIVPIRNQVGKPISSFYGYQVDGIWQSQSEVDAANAIDGDAATIFQEGAADGRFRYRDINGDGKINTEDRTFLGSPVPDFTGGLNLKLTYKGFELQTYMFMQTGNEIFNISKLFTDFYPLFSGAAISARVKDSWTPENSGAKIPIYENVSNFSTTTQSNSFYVEDGSYFRMQNISIAYNLPAATLSKLRLQKLRFFAGVNNVFTITGYDGLDPSVGGDADTRLGIDIGNYPITRSWTFGLNLGL
ncbi:MAG TPA: TonB-dependent receptor [Cyclobacteriaceae bacterium]|nr:TonB-dependent receptor [Cyclobacteriaceae bacterium]